MKHKYNAEEHELQIRIFKSRYENIKREGAKELLKWLEENGFFEAPASTKYHGSYPGGLVEHSNNVFTRCETIADEMFYNYWNSQEKYSMETIAIVSLLHDVCKMDVYKPEYSENGEVQQYSYSDDFPVGHGEKSVIQIMRFMKLTDEEIMAISWHMGEYDNRAKGGSRDKDKAFKMSELIAILHIADMMAAHLDEREREDE